MHSGATPIADICSVIILGLLLSACQGTETFSNVARAGDTISVAVGIDPQASRDTVHVTVRDAAGGTTQYLPGDPRIRAVMNLYPDPESYFVVGAATGQALRSNEPQYGTWADSVADIQRDWRQTVAFIDLPGTMALGQARITVNTPSSNTSSFVEVLPGTGSQHLFQYTGSGGDQEDRVRSMERMNAIRAGISGVMAVPPAAVEYRFTHDPDSTQGGTGKAHVTHARGDLAGVVWRDNGTQLNIIVTSNVADTEFDPDIMSVVISGGITGVTPAGVTAVDSAGNVLSGIDMTVTPKIDSLNPAGALSGGTTYTLQGTSLCNLCDGSEEGLWYRVQSGWYQATVTNLTSTSISFSLPGGVETGAAYLWLGNTAGSTVLPVQIQ